jgi:acetylornithine deacetylase/succinyl-diaminopimelate desuccinylase-like protein
MAGVCLSIEDKTQELKKTSHPLVGSPTIVVTTPGGGENESFVPDSCTIGINRRLQHPKDQLNRLFEKPMSCDSALKITTRVTVECEPSETRAEEPIVQAKRAVTKITGRDPGITGFPAACDMRFMGNQGRMPTVILGPGSLHQEPFDLCSHLFRRTSQPRMNSDDEKFAYGDP